MGVDGGIRSGHPWAGPVPRLRSSILVKLTALIVALEVVTAGSLIVAGYRSASVILRRQVEERLAQVLAARQTMLLDFAGRQEERVTRLSRRPRLRLILESLNGGNGGPGGADEARAELERVLRESRDGTQSFQEVWAVDAAGTLLASTDPRPGGGMPPEARPLVEARSEPHQLTVPFQTGAGYASLLSAPLRTPEGRGLGALIVQVDATQMAGFLQNPSGLGETGEVIVGTRKGGGVHVFLPSRVATAPGDYPASKMPALARAVNGREGFLRAADDRGVDVLAAYRPVGYAGWGIAAKMDAAEAYQPVGRLGRTMAAVGAGVVLAALAASYGVARWFTRPVRRLSEAAAAVAGGDFATRVTPATSDELGALGLVFNRMTEELARSHATLEARIADRTREVEASRDLLDVFFTISTSLHQAPGDLEKTFDAVLHSCEGLGYHLAMLSLIDRAANALRAVRAVGTMTDIIARTVRPLDGTDVLALAARDGRTLVVADATTDPRCDRDAAAAAGVRGMVVLPLVSGEVLGTLQVAAREAIDPALVDLRPLETLAGQAARALAGLNQVMEIRRLNSHLEAQALELARSEAAVREQTRILQSVLSSMGEGVVVADERGRFLLFNPAAERVLGSGRTAAPPEDWSDLYRVFQPEDTHAPYPGADLPLVRAMRGESVDDVVLYVRNPRLDAGVYVSCSARPLRDEAGALRGGLVVFRDITERRRAERALKKNAEEIEDLYNNSPCGYHSVDASETLVRMNNTELAWLGYAREEVVGALKFADLLTAESREVFRASFPEFVARGWVQNLEFQFVRKDGTTFPVLLNSTAIKDAAGGFVASRSTVYDMTERKRAERRAGAQLATTRVLAESASLEEAATKVLEAVCEHLGWDFAAVWRVDRQSDVLRCMGTWRRPGAGPDGFDAMTRRPPVARGAGLPGRVWALGRAAWAVDLAAPAAEDGLPASSPAGDATAVAEGLRAGFAAPIALKGDVLGVLEFYSRTAQPRDDELLQTVTNLGSRVGLFIERQQMRARVIQSEKLASLGMLSAGVAHEINNPLAYVANNLVVLGRDVQGLRDVVTAYERAAAEPGASLPPAAAAEVERIAAEIDLPYVKENVGRILESTRQGVKRVADIVQNLRGFARLDQAAVERVDLHEAILGGLEMIRGRLDRKGIAVDLKFGELPPLTCEPAQLNQVFLNLLVNAMQAVEANHAAGGGRIEVTTQDGHGEVVVEVQDNGCGIPPDVLPRIFDPFFTTKAVGEGTGLGLSISHGIVSDHGGRMEVESTPGRGTRFRVILPLGGKARGRDHDRDHDHDRDPTAQPAALG